MTLKHQMLGILRGGETARISFTFTDTNATEVTVGPDNFRRVANAISSDAIHIVEGGVQENWAKYTAWDNPTNHTNANTFYVGPNMRSSRAFDALMVHESVHASFDLLRTTIPWVDNEAAAYIAQGMYLRNSGYRRSRLDPTEHANIGYLIADEIADGEGVSDFFLSRLRSDLRGNSAYSSYINTTFTGDG